MSLSAVTPFPIIAVRDMATAARFYDEILDLEQVSDHDMVQLWRAGDGHIMLSRNEAGSKAEHTVAGWMVDDLDAHVHALRGKGVQFEDFGMPSEDGIVSFGEARVAYFRDPDGNLLSMTQLG